MSSKKRTVRDGYVKLAAKILKIAERDIIRGVNIKDAAFFVESEFALALRMYIDEYNRLDKTRKGKDFLL